MAALAPITSLLMPLLRKYLYVTEDIAVHEQLTIAFNQHANSVGDGQWIFFIPFNVADLEGREYLKYLAMALAHVTGESTYVDYNIASGFFRVGTLSAMEEDETYPAGEVLEMISINLIRAINFRLDPAVLQMQVPDAALFPVGDVDVESPVILPQDLYYGAGNQPVVPPVNLSPPPPPPGPPALPASAQSTQSFSPVGPGFAPTSPPAPVPNHGHNRGPPKPPNRWILFLKANYHEVLSQNPGMHTSNISKIVKQRYQALTPLEMQQWVDAAAAAKELHQQMYPGYRCAPRKSSAIKKRKKTVRVSQELTLTSVPIEYEGNLQLVGATEEVIDIHGAFIEPSGDENSVSEEEFEVEVEEQAVIEDTVEDAEITTADISANFEEDF